MKGKEALEELLKYYVKGYDNKTIILNKWTKTRINTIKAELDKLDELDKISEDDLEFIFKWANRGIWQEREKRFNIMRRIKNPLTLSCYKIIIKELNSNYDRIRTLKSIGGNK